MNGKSNHSNWFNITDTRFCNRNPQFGKGEKQYEKQQQSIIWRFQHENISIWSMHVWIQSSGGDLIQVTFSVKIHNYQPKSVWYTMRMCFVFFGNETDTNWSNKRVFGRICHSWWYGIETGKMWYDLIQKVTWNQIRIQVIRILWWHLKTTYNRDHWYFLQLFCFNADNQSCFTVDTNLK